MNVLLITGTLAQQTIQTFAQKSLTPTKVLTLPVPVAAFLTPQTIATALRNVDLTGVDVVLVPGLVRGDVSTVSAAVGFPVFKGSRYAADLPTVLDSLGEVTLSTTEPACTLLAEKLRQNALNELSKAEENKSQLLQRPHNMLIKQLAVGKDFPMRVLAEIVDAPLMPTEEVRRLAKKYVHDGAAIVDLGMIAGDSHPKDAQRLVQAVKAVVDVPVSIDTLNPWEIEAAVLAGVDLILSLDAGNLEQLACFAKDVPVVVIPTNQRDGYFPKKASDRVAFLEATITKAKQLGFTKIIADLILEPTDILESFAAFRMFAQRNPSFPMLIGVSNVTELMDADSVGVNALLAQLASEANISILLGAEKGTHAQGSIHEQVTAAKMMFLAKKRGSVPKDLGIDLLILKDKCSREEPYDGQLETQASLTIATDPTGTFTVDPKGNFKIAIDRVSGEIVAVHFADADLKQPANVVKGKSAQAVYGKLVELGLVSRLEHAAYLGCELGKAEVALQTGKAYLQDGPLFGY